MTRLASTAIGLLLLSAPAFAAPSSFGPLCSQNNNCVSGVTATEYIILVGYVTAATTLWHDGELIAYTNLDDPTEPAGPAPGFHTFDGYDDSDELVWVWQVREGYELDTTAESVPLIRLENGPPVMQATCCRPIDYVLENDPAA